LCKDAKIKIKDKDKDLVLPRETKGIGILTVDWGTGFPGD